jgi:hypothetical protein
MESWMEARRTYKPTSQQTTATEAKPVRAPDTTDVELVEDECGRNVLSLPPELIIRILEYLPLDELVFHVRLVNCMWNTFALNQARLLVADRISMATRGITASLQFLYRGDTSEERFIFKRRLSTCNDQWPISLDFGMDRGSRHEYLYRHRFPVVKGIDYPVVKSLELYLTESDSPELIVNSERTELKPRLFLRFEPEVDRQNYSAGNKRGSIWIEFYWNKTVREILNLKPILSKDFGLKFDFVWETLRGLYDDRLYCYTDHGSISRIARAEDIEAGSLYIF